MSNIVYLFKGGDTVPTIFDVAYTFLNFESMSNKKLQKICYYAQAWHLALFNNEPLFREKFEAWVHGPVCRELYNVYKEFGWTNIECGKMGKAIEDTEKLEFLKVIYNTYGGFDGDELESLTHSEEPWLEARRNLEEWEPSSEYIKEETMMKFYLNSYEQAQHD